MNVRAEVQGKVNTDLACTECGHRVCWGLGCLLQERSQRGTGEACQDKEGPAEPPTESLEKRTSGYQVQVCVVVLAWTRDHGNRSN